MGGFDGGDVGQGVGEIPGGTGASEPTFWTSRSGTVALTDMATGPVRGGFWGGGGVRPNQFERIQVGSGWGGDVSQSHPHDALITLKNVA